MNVWHETNSCFYVWTQSKHSSWFGSKRLTSGKRLVKQWSRPPPTFFHTLIMWLTCPVSQIIVLALCSDNINVVCLILFFFFCISVISAAQIAYIFAVVFFVHGWEKWNQWVVSSKVELRLQFDNELYFQSYWKIDWKSVFNAVFRYSTYTILDT